MKNNGEAHLFLQELLEEHIELHLIFLEHLHFWLMQYLLQWQLTNPCLLPDVIIEADRRDSELEGTSCASMKLSALFIASIQPLKLAFLRAQQIKPRRGGTKNCELGQKVLIVHTESVISIWFRLHINQVYLAPRIHVMWKEWTYN